jgi:hypothetical protein
MLHSKFGWQISRYNSSKLLLIVFRMREVVDGERTAENLTHIHPERCWCDDAHRIAALGVPMYSSE